MSKTYQALAQLLAYPTEDTQVLCAEIARVVTGEGLLPRGIVANVSALAQEIANDPFTDETRGAGNQYRRGGFGRIFRGVLNNELGELGPTSKREECPRCDPWVADALIADSTKS